MLMRINPDGTILLEKGETLPMECPCGHLYIPEAGSERSVCPKCGKRNEHSEQEWVETMPINYN